MTLSALTDSAVKERAKSGDKAALSELIKRGLAGDPVLLKEARTASKRPWRDKGYA